MNIEIELSGARTAAITGHIRPDGDCVGSVMGLYQYMKTNMPEIHADIYLEEPGKEFNYIKDIDRICYDTKGNKTYDVCIVLDCSDKDRLGDFVKYFDGAAKTICIDHHISNMNYADVNLVEPYASSTCEVLYKTLDAHKIDRETAVCLYTGIIHDTGVFKYSCTSADTMAIAGKLMEKGIPYSDIIDNSFYKKTYIQNQVLGRALLESVLFYNGMAIFSKVTRKEMEFYNIEGKQLGGIIEQLRLTEGVEVSIFMYETGVNEYKVSMRSQNIIDVSRIAVYFGGGGHIRAAGFTAHGTVHDIINNIGSQLELQFKEHKQEKLQ